MTILSRRNFILGAASLLAAPAIVRPESLMPIFVPKPAPDLYALMQAHLDRLVSPPLLGVDVDQMWNEMAAFGQVWTRTKTLIKWSPEAERLTDWPIVAEIVAADWTPREIKAPPGGFKIARA